MSVADAGWTGCHGARLHSDVELGLGACRGRPLLDATVEAGAVESPAGEAVWSVRSPGSSSINRLYQEPSGTHVLEVGGDRRIAIGTGDRRITLGLPVDAVQVQLLVSFALPLLLHDAPALMLHSAAVARGGAAVLLAGPGGAGKSAALVGLINAGWQAVSEDVSALGMEESRPVVWPGPPWVRLRAGEPAPAGSQPLFSSGDKTAWDLAPWQPSAPVSVAAIVLLEPPGGEAPRWEPLSPPQALAALAAHSVWLGPPAQRGRRLFEPVTAAANRLAVARLRLPASPTWRDQLAMVLDEEIPPG